MRRTTVSRRTEPSCGWVLLACLVLVTMAHPSVAEGEKLTRKALYFKQVAPEGSEAEGGAEAALLRLQSEEISEERAYREVCRAVADEHMAALEERGDARLRRIRSTSVGSPADALGNLTNFLPRAGIGAASDAEGGSNESDSMDILTLDYSFVLPSFVKERNGMLHAKINRSPEVFPLIRAALPKDPNDAEQPDPQLLDSLEDQLGDGDDYTLSFSWNVLTRTLGRSTAMHQSLRDQLEKDLAAAADVELTSRLTSRRLSLDSMDSRQLREVVLPEARDAVKKESEKSLIERFDALVNNQPQLILTGDRTLRGALAGPNETRITVTWEQPLGPNINRFWKFFNLQDHNCTVSDTGEVTENCVRPVLGRYLKRSKNSNQADKGFRSSFSLSYSDIGAFDFERTLDGNPVSIHTEGAEELTVGAGIGRSFGLGSKENDDPSEVLEPQRIDLKLSFATSSDDDQTPDELKRLDRFRAELAYSVRYGQLDIPISLVYVNKPEFLALEDFDEEVSARVGIKFTIPDSPKGKPSGNGG